MIFQALIIWFNRIHSLKYLRYATFGSKDLVIRKSEFVAKTQFFCGNRLKNLHIIIQLKTKYMEHFIISKTTFYKFFWCFQSSGLNCTLSSNITSFPSTPYIRKHKKVCFHGVRYFLKGNFPSNNFPNVLFPKRQLPKGKVRPSKAPQAAKGPSASARTAEGLSAAARTDLGNGRSGNCTVRKLPLGKKNFWESTIT